MTTTFLKKQPQVSASPGVGMPRAQPRLAGSDPFLILAESQARGTVSGAGTVVVKVRTPCGLISESERMGPGAVFLVSPADLTVK